MAGQAGQASAERGWDGSPQILHQEKHERKNMVVHVTGLTGHFRKIKNKDPYIEIEHI